MGMAVNTNLASINAQRNLSNTQNDLSKSLEKLSSGLRINRAADDAAGLSMSEGLRAQSSGMAVAARNAQDGISVIQTAEGALTEVHSILQRMRDLAVQGGNDSNNGDARTAIKTEADELSKELRRLTESTSFNGLNLMKGADMTFQVGADGDATAGAGVNTISVKVADIATGLGGLMAADATTAGTGFDVTDNAAAATTIEAIDTAITAISTQRSSLGAAQNRFESAINSLNVGRENLTAAESRIRDVDMAAEMVNFTRANIMSQAGTAMLAQANQSNQGVLQLLG
ncbi:flagellin N-terminal helical domain-containing protein [Arthrobacter halodurans]|uniref:Flagellin n=1 Tax=Arthrobacter halodurans TaxID=516699 RepID=A0ABV4USY5_9MICC